MTSKKPDPQRRQFLATTISSVGVAITASSVASQCLATQPANSERLGPPIVQEKNKKGKGYVSLKDAHIGTQEIDLRIMNQFGEQPQEVLDFYVACRAALTGDNAQQDLIKACHEAERLKLGGPLLGDLGTTRVSVWMSLPQPDVVQVVVKPKNGGAAMTFKSDGNDAIEVVRCEGLLPETGYQYTVVNSKNEPLGKGHFVTPPNELSKKPFRIAVGADFHKIGMYRPELMKLAQDRGSIAMLLIGDSAVDGRKDDFGLISTDYMLRNLSPPIQRLTANVPVSCTWDDHDYWGNDASGTLTKSKKPIDVVGLRKSWQANWNNPQRDLDRAGIYFETHIGPIHYIALDTRSCRVNAERGKLNCFLGAEQMDWLKETIAASTSPFILVSSGTMWTDYISAGKDSWGKWDVEGREMIFEMLDQKKNSQVILLSGDRHGARGFKIPREDGSVFYEFEVGTLGGVPGPKAFGADRSNQLFGIPARSWAFGELTFSKLEGEPHAEFRLINEQGKILETVVITA